MTNKKGPAVRYIPKVKVTFGVRHTEPDLFIYDVFVDSDDTNQRARCFPCRF